MGTGSEREAGHEPGGAGWVPWVAAAVLLGLLLLAYAPALRAGYIWDDDRYVTENPNLRSTQGLARIWLDPGANPQYYPLVHTSFWLEYQLWGLAPAGYHLDNVLLHALAALLLWRILLRLRVPGAGLAAAIFALHPVMVESVAWITERKNVLSGAAYLGAFLAYLRFLTGSARAGSYYGLALLLFLLALLSKTVTASLPLALALTLWWQRGRLGREDLLPLLPLLALGAVLGLHTVHLEATQVGAHGAAWELSFVERCLVAGRALWFYAAKLVWPDPLVFIYPRWSPDAGAAWQYLYPLAALALLVALWRLRFRLGRGPVAAALYFGATLFPALGFFDVYPMRFSFVADHFQYLASLGPIVLLSAAGATHLRPALLRRSVAMALLLACAALTWSQAAIYRDAETLWRATLVHNPRAAIAHNNLAGALLAQGRGEEALAPVLAALELESTMYEAHNNLGIIYQLRGDLDRAVEAYHEALRLRPDSFDAHANLGAAELARGRLDEAELHLREALRIQPQHLDSLVNLASVLAARGDAAGAVALLERAVVLRPQDEALQQRLRKFRRRAPAPTPSGR